MNNNITLKDELLQPEGNGDYRIHKNGSGVYLAQYMAGGIWTTFTEEKAVPNQEYKQEKPVGGFYPDGAFNYIFRLMQQDVITTNDQKHSASKNYKYSA